MASKGGFKRFIRQARAAHAQMPSRVEFGYFGPSAIDAAMNEFGIPERGIPERPALRQAIKESLDAMRKELARTLLASGTMSVTEKDAERLGRIVTDNLEARLRAGVWPENAPWKNIDKPSLQFTGKMLESVGVRVVK